MVKIIIEGGPKSGKTTLAAAILRLLKGYDVPIVSDGFGGFDILANDPGRLKRQLDYQKCVEIEIRQLPRKGS